MLEELLRPRYAFAAADVPRLFRPPESLKGLRTDLRCRGLKVRKDIDIMSVEPDMGELDRWADLAAL